MELIIEQVSRSQKLLQRHKISGPEISIGRGYDNDLMLSDPYICPHHLSLNVTEDGIWQVCDQDSANGSFTDNQKPLKGCQPIRSGDVVSIGKSYLRFIYPNQPVAPAIRLSGLEGLLNWLSSPLVVISIFCTYVALLLCSYYFQSSVEIKTTQMFSSIFARVAIMSFIPLLFAAMARLFKHDARLLTQAAVCYCFFIAAFVLDGLGALISFNSNQTWMTSVFANITQVGLIFTLLWASLYIAFHQGTFRRTMMAGGITLGIFMLSYLYNSGNRIDFNPKPMYDNTLLAPEFALSSPVTIKEFIADSEAVFDLTTKKAAEGK